MKIGTFARRHQISIDTVRHYIGLELLIPKKINGQYDFDAQCENDLDEVLHLKALGFSLFEIKNILLVKHLGKLTDFQQQEQYQNIFTEKCEKIDAEIEKRRQEKSLLQQELRKLSAYRERERHRFGIDLDWIRYLRCDRCGGVLRLKSAVVDDNDIVSGRLQCACGTEYAVTDGILAVDTGYMDDGVLPDIVSYIRQTDDEYLRYVEKNLVWNIRQLSSYDLSGKVILEPGCGSGFLLRRIYDSLPESAVYIAVDHSFARLQFLKNALNNAEKKKKILFICCDFSRLPLLPRSIDVICDFSGTSNYGFDHGEFMLNVIEHCFKEDAALVGSYIIFKNFSLHSKIPAGCRANFRIDSVRGHLEQLGFLQKDERISDTVAKGGIYENFFLNDEKIRNYSFAGKRSG